MDSTVPTSLRRTRGVVAATALPLLVRCPVRDPGAILSIGGIATAALTPLLVTLPLYSPRRLPVGL